MSLLLDITGVCSLRHAMREQRSFIAWRLGKTEPKTPFANLLVIKYQNHLEHLRKSQEHTRSLYVVIIKEKVQNGRINVMPAAS